MPFIGQDVLTERIKRFTILAATDEGSCLENRFG